MNVTCPNNKHDKVPKILNNKRENKSAENGNEAAHKKATNVFIIASNDILYSHSAIHIEHLIKRRHF